MTLTEMFKALPEDLEGEVSTATQKFINDFMEEYKKEDGCNCESMFKYLVEDAYRIHIKDQKHKEQSKLPFKMKVPLWESWEGGPSTGTVINGTERPHELGSQLDSIQDK